MRTILNFRILLQFVIGGCFLNDVYSQNVGVNATGSPPAASAILDVSATDRGLLIPRSLTDTADVTTISSPATSA